MQLVRDVAPAARQSFHTAFDGQANFATGILELANDAGADVIVDDVIYFAEPMFQDGIIAQAVDSVKAGVAYFSSAGNGGRNSLIGTGTTIFAFQWDEPFASVSGAPGSAGGTPILFDIAGNRIATETRLKPNFTGPDGGITTFSDTLRQPGLGRIAIVL